MTNPESTPSTPSQAAPAADSTPSTEGAAPRNEVKVDDSGAFAAYANFARVTGTPEEIIIDFGLNAQPMAQGDQEVKVSQRLIMNFFAAKRLLAALGMTVQRYEGAFGALELDVNRRVTPAAAQNASKTLAS